MPNRITERTADIHRGAAIMLSRIHAAQECDHSTSLMVNCDAPTNIGVFDNC